MSEIDQTQEDLEPMERIAVAVDQIAKALEEMPARIDAERRSGTMTNRMLGQLKESFERGAADRKAAHAERRANIAIGLAALTALSGLIAAVAVLIQG